MKFILGALIGLLVLLQYEFWFSDGGMKTVWQLKKDIAHQQAVNDALSKQNNALSVDISRLKYGENAVESRARNELGMTKKGEVFFQIVK